MNDWVWIIVCVWLFVMLAKSRMEINELREMVKHYHKLHREQIVKQVKDFQGGRK